MTEFKVRSALSAPDACSQLPGCMQRWRGPMARPHMSAARAATAVHTPALCTADCTPTAILTLTAQTHDSFGMTELTRAEAAAARAKTSGFGAGMRV